MGVIHSSLWLKMRAEAPIQHLAWDADAGTDGQDPRDHAPGLSIDVTSDRVASPAFEPDTGVVANPVIEPSAAPRADPWRGKAIAAVACVVFALTAVGRRETVVRLLPGSAGLFAAMGLPVNLRGLEFRNMRSRVIEDGGQRILAVEGDIANDRRTKTRVPDLALAILSSDGRTIYSWTTPAPKTEVAVGETVYFRARLAAPPADGRAVKIQFASATPDQRGKPR